MPGAQVQNLHAFPWLRTVQLFRNFNFLLTLRGILVLLFVVLLITGPARGEHDIIASIFAYSLASAIGVCLVFTVAQGIRLRKTLRVSLHSPAEGMSGESVTSGSVTRFLLRTSPVQIAPFFVLTIEPEFEYPGVSPSIHRLTGSAYGDRLLNEFLTFPHRGEWNITRITASLGDQFGFTQLRWEMDPNPAQVFRVEPPVAAPSARPVISSCQRSGDIVLATQERLGDPFDLKSYHPSDGLKKVVWKIYARTGELIARHPEHTMTPEGQVIVYAVADTDEDYLCSEVLAYLKQLHDLDLELFFGCDGMEHRKPARSVADACDLLVKTAWGSSHGSDDILALLEYCSGQLIESRIDKIVLFAARSRLAESSYRERLTSMASLLESRQIVPVFYLIEGPVSRPLNMPTNAPIRNSSTAALAAWFLGTSRPLSPELPAPIFQEFMALCSRRNWEVVT